CFEGRSRGVTRPIFQSCPHPKGPYFVKSGMKYPERCVVVASDHGNRTVRQHASVAPDKNPMLGYAGRQDLPFQRSNGRPERWPWIAMQPPFLAMPIAS